MRTAVVDQNTETTIHYILCAHRARLEESKATDHNYSLIFVVGLKALYSYT